MVRSSFNPDDFTTPSESDPKEALCVVLGLSDCDDLPPRVRDVATFADASWDWLEERINLRCDFSTVPRGDVVAALKAAVHDPAVPEQTQLERIRTIAAVLEIRYSIDEKTPASGDPAAATAADELRKLIAAAESTMKGLDDWRGRTGTPLVNYPGEFMVGSRVPAIDFGETMAAIRRMVRFWEQEVERLRADAAPPRRSRGRRPKALNSHRARRILRKACGLSDAHARVLLRAADIP